MYFIHTIRHIVFIAALAVILTSSFFTLAAESSTEDNPKWYLGEGLGVLDSFTYKICTDRILPSIDSECIVVQLEFIDRLQEWNGPVWVVQARFGSSESPEPIWQNTILHIDTNGKFSIVSNSQHRTLSSIITNTLFWMDTHAKNNSAQDLEIGAYWGNVMSNRLYVFDIDMGTINNAPVEIITVGYNGNKKDSHIQIVDEFPFPIKATVYRPLAGTMYPKIHYEFELLNYKPGSTIDQESEIELTSVHTDDANATSLETLDLILSDPQKAAMLISNVCKLDHTAHNVNENIIELCLGKLLEYDTLNDGAYAENEPYDKYTIDRNSCRDSNYEEMCYGGIVTSINNTTLEIDNTTVRLSLISISDDDESQNAVRSYLESECKIGSWASVDIDDLRPIDINANSLGVVYCQSDKSVNAMLVQNGLASVDPLQCVHSEFAVHDWALHVCNT